MASSSECLPSAFIFTFLLVQGDLLVLVGPDSGLMLKLPKSLTPEGDWLTRPQVLQRAAQGQVSWICTNHSLTYFFIKRFLPSTPCCSPGLRTSQAGASQHIPSPCPLASAVSLLSLSDKAGHAYSHGFEGTGCPVVRVVQTSISSGGH